MRRKLVKCLYTSGLIPLDLTMLSWPKLLRTQTAARKILGKVTDNTGAEFYDVVIPVTNSGTGIRRQVSTDEYGKYSAEPLLPSTYWIKGNGEGPGATHVTRVEL